MRDRIIFSDNQQVSPRQISRALFLEMLGISTLLLPSLLVQECGVDGVFALFAGGICARLLLLFGKKNYTKVEIISTNEQYYNTKVLKYGTKIVCGGWFLGLAGFGLYLLTTLVEEQLLGKQYEAAIVLTLAGAAFWGLWKGLESRLRVYEVLFWLLVLPLLVILLAACSGVNPDYWAPVADTGWFAFGKGVACSFLFFSLSYLPFACSTQCSRPQKLYPAMVRCLWAVVGCNVVIYLILLGVFQVGLLGHRRFPIIDLMAVVKLPGNFLERQDALMMGIWFFCLFAFLNSMLHYATAHLAALGEQKEEKAQKSRRYISGVCTLLMVGIAVWLLREKERAEGWLNVYLWGLLPAMLVASFLLQWIRTKKMTVCGGGKTDEK